MSDYDRTFDEYPHLSPAQRADERADDRRRQAQHALHEGRTLDAVAHALLAIEAQLEVLQLVVEDR